jgi:diguanylate cyclase (GGDEF)-like protein
MAALRRDDGMGGSTRQVLRTVGGWHVWDLPRSACAYIVGVTCAAAFLAILAAARSPWHLHEIVVFVALLGCGLLAIESTRNVKEVHGTIGRDLQTVWYLAVAVTLPPACALLAPVPFTAYKLWRVRRGFVYRRIFSNATISLAYGAASLLFHEVRRTAFESVPGSGTRALIWTLVVVGCGALAWVINNGLLLTAIKLADHEARFRDLVGNREAITADLLELSLASSLALVVAISPFLMALALPSVVLYRNYLINSQLAAQARIDAKTGLLNAGTWRHEAEIEFLRALRARTPLALAMVNIDHFDDVNEMAGQPVRDQIIRDIAGIIKDQLPGCDLIGRFGGEDFVILFPQTGRDEARKITERLRDHIAGEPIAIESGTQAGFVFRLTVSIGVAVLNESRRALKELIGAADTALEQAKSTGWNKVYVSSDAAGEADFGEEDQQYWAG